MIPSCWRVVVRALGALAVLTVAALAVRGRLGALDVAEALQVVRAMGFPGALLLSLAWIPLTLVALPISPLSIAAGWLYGPILGTLLACPAATIAALVPFVLGRTLLHGWARARWERDPSLRALAVAAHRRGLRVALYLRLLPFAPFPILNFTFGATPMRARDFAIGTCIGIAPMSLLWNSLGARLAAAGRSAASGPPPLPGWVVVAGAALVGLSLWASWRELAALLREGAAAPDDVSRDLPPRR